MAWKKRPQSVANLARAEGLPIPPLPGSSGSKTDQPALTNPIKLHNPDRSIYMELWQNYDMQQCCARYRWKNLPNGLLGWQLERMLYYRGSIAAFRVDDKFYALPYVIQGNINLYGMPTKIRPMAYNGKPLEKDSEDKYNSSEEYAFKVEGSNQAFDLPVDLLGDETDKYSAVILYDTVPTFVGGGAPAMYNRSRLIIKEMADVLARININIVVSNKKILLHIKDAKQAKVIQEELRIAFGSDCPFGVLTSEFDVNSVQSTSDYNADDMFNALKNYDAIRCFMAGINSRGFGTEKQERLITGELNGDIERVELISDQGLELRKIWAELCNKKFGTNIEVELRSDAFKDQLDGKGLDQEEEMKTANKVGGSENE